MPTEQPPRVLVVRIEVAGRYSAEAVTDEIASTLSYSNGPVSVQDVTSTVESAIEILRGTLQPCTPDCECILHDIDREFGPEK